MYNKTQNKRKSCATRRRQMNRNGHDVVIRRKPGCFGQKEVVPSAMVVAHALSFIPKGRLIEWNSLGIFLAKTFGADSCCMLTLGRHLVAIERARWIGEDGMVAPFWRVVRQGGLVYPKYEAGGEQAAWILETEGHAVKHKKPFFYGVLQWKPKCYTPTNRQAEDLLRFVKEGPKFTG